MEGLPETDDWTAWGAGRDAGCGRAPPSTSVGSDNGSSVNRIGPVFPGVSTRSRDYGDVAAPVIRLESPTPSAARESAARGAATSRASRSRPRMRSGAMKWLRSAFPDHESRPPRPAQGLPGGMSTAGRSQPGSSWRLRATSVTRCAASSRPASVERTTSRSASPPASPCAAITIRRFGGRTFTIDELVELGSLPPCGRAGGSRAPSRRQPADQGAVGNGSVAETFLHQAWRDTLDQAVDIDTRPFP